MTQEMIICFVVFVVMIILFFTNKIPMSFTALGVMVVLVLFGCVDASTAIGTFGSNTVITMASMFVVAAGLARTQMINKITKLLYKVTDGSFTKILASYVIITCIIGQFVPSIVAIFALVQPLAQNMCDKMNISPSKMMFPLAIAAVSTSFIIEPIGPYAAWYVTQNGYMESYGWTATKLNMWNETLVFLPVGIVTILLAIFVIPRFLPDTPDRPIEAIQGRKMQEQEPLSPVREFLGYGVFVVVIIGLMLGFTSYTKIGLRMATFAGAICSAACLIIALVYLVMKLIWWDRFPAGMAPLLIGMLFLGSIQIFFIGLVGEYILSINQRVMHRPLVIEEERINFEPKEQENTHEGDTHKGYAHEG